jgi:hypothetical protein
MDVCSSARCEACTICDPLATKHLPIVRDLCAEMDQVNCDGLLASSLKNVDEFDAFLSH